MHKDNPELFRYVRPLQFDLNKLEMVDKPTGGIAFLFNIDQEREKLSFIVVICRDDENFNYELCRKIAFGRKEKYGFDYTIDYDRTISLVDNVILWITGFDKNITSSLITLKNKLKTILKNNQRVNEEFHDFREILSKNRHKILNWNN